jgi:DNA processing protein
VVGSRDVDDALVEYTESIGRLTAKARKTLVSGGARGIDQAAMRGALEAGGMVSGVLADSLERSAMNREHRRAIDGGPTRPGFAL